MQNIFTYVSPASGAEGAYITGLTLTVLERFDKRPGNAVMQISSGETGALDFNLRPGSFFLQYGSDLIPFRVTETSGSVLFNTLIEL